MIATIAHNIAPIMFVAVMGLLLVGYPVAFTLAGGGLYFFLVGIELGHLAPAEITLDWPLLQAHTSRVLGVMSNETLLAVPFFTFMGIVLERSGMAEELLDTIGQIFGSVRGGLAYAVIVVGALLAATTGVVAASVIAMGLISLPIMLRYGYAARLATGTIAASGALVQIVPPSLVLIVMADQLGQPVGDMYRGAVVPGLILVAAYCLYVFVVTVLRPGMAPALPPEARRFRGGGLSLAVLAALGVAAYVALEQLVFAGLRGEVAIVWSAVGAGAAVFAVTLANRALGLGLLSELAERVVFALMPPLALIFLVLGTILLGVATPTEGGAMGAVGALLLALARRKLDLGQLFQALDATTRLSAFVMFIVIGARVFALTFYGVNGNVWMEELLLALPGGEYGFLIVVSVIIFVLGCFLDFFEIAFIVLPLLAPAAASLGIDPVWFGVILAVNLQTSFLTPPFGFALFYLRSVVPVAPWLDRATGRTMPPVRTADIYRGVLPFILVQLAVLALIIAVPSLVTHYRQPPPPIEPGGTEIELPPLGEGGGLFLPPLVTDPELAAPPDLSQPPSFD
jgi:tripartite ATP-independent transporter DctM subunit